MAELLQWIVDFLVWVVESVFVAVIQPLICLLYGIFMNPFGWFVDVFIIPMVDFFVAVLPDYPPAMSASALINGLSSSLPEFGRGEILEIISGFLGILVISVLFKLIKYLPFV